MAGSDRKRGLGRGLSALMSDVAVAPERTSSPAERKNIQVLPVELIEPNPDQPRKAFRQEDMEELRASIQEKGIIQPLVVRPIAGDRFQIVAGERRWRAAQLAKLHEVPVVIRDFSDVEVIEIAIIENIQRADLNPVEEAQGYRQLMDRFGHTQEKLAEALGKSRSYIANLLRLLQLPEKVIAMIEDGKLSAGHARALITARDPEALATQVVSQGLSVRATEALVRKQAEMDGKSRPRNPSPSTKDADTRALEGDLSAALGMRVTLAHEAGTEGGVLTIRYHTLEQLDELCGRLGGN